MIPVLEMGDSVELIFDDFTTRDDKWLEMDQAKDDTPVKVHLVGIYISHDDQVIRVAFSMVMTDQSVGTLAMVPMGALKSVKRLEAQDVSIDS